MTATTTTPAAATLGDAPDHADAAAPADVEAPGDEPPEPGSNAPSSDAPPADAPDADPPELHLLVAPARLEPGQQQWLREHLAAALPHLSRPVARLAVRVVDDESMVALHRRHLGLDATTDVLTFEQSPPEAPIDVDIAANIDEARRRASTLGHDHLRELLLYVLHGLLHCCAGFDDHDDESAAAMHAEEDRLLEAVGVGAVYRAAEPGR